MTDPLFLLYLPDFFGVQGARARLFQADGNLVSNSLPDAETRGPVVTFDVPTLVDEYRRQGVSLPRMLVDTGEALRLITGRARDEGVERSWNVHKTLPSFTQKSHIVKAFCLLAMGREQHPELAQIEEIIAAASEALRNLWASVCKRLDDSGETQRFWTVEVPFSQICWHRQWNGIRLNQRAIEDAISSVRSEKYSSYISIAELTKVSPSGMSFRNVRGILADTELSFLLESPEGTDLEAEMRIAASHSTLADNFVQYVRASRDEMVLSRLAGDIKRVHPTFQPMGTVTGRVLVADPYLQNLRKKYRSVIQAEEGKALAYLDYSQFEPGVAAHLSRDPVLVADYNKGDVYKKLSVDI